MTRKEWLIAAILTLVTVLAWVVFDILHTRSQVEIPQKIQEVLEQVNPEFDTSNLESTP